jgi:hypothetical protein
MAPLWLTLLFTAVAASKEPLTVHIALSQTPDFDVVHHRATSNAIGVALFGAIGAGVQASVEHARDVAKRDQLRPYVSEGIWDEAFVAALEETFAQKGFTVRESPAPKEDAANSALYLVVRPHSFGIRVVDTTTVYVSTYVQFEVTYGRELGELRRNAFEDSYYMTGDRQVSYADLLADPGELNDDLANLLSQAARRVANKLIYNSEQPGAG